MVLNSYTLNSVRDGILLYCVIGSGVENKDIMLTRLPAVIQWVVSLAAAVVISFHHIDISTKIYRTKEDMLYQMSK